MGIFPDSSFFLFLIAAFLAFYVPGNVFLHKKLEHNFLANFVIGTTLGIVLWSIVGFVTGYLGLRMLMYPYLFLTFVIWLKLNFRSISNFNLKGVKVDILSAVIVVVFFVFVAFSVYILTKAFGVYMGYEPGGLGYFGIALIISGLTTPARIWVAPLTDALEPARDFKSSNVL